MFANLKKIILNLFLGCFLALLFSGCSGDLSATCDGKKSGIRYSESDYEKLLETKNCENCKLNGDEVDLSNFDFSGSNLRGAELAGANLRGAKLTGGDFSGSILGDRDGGNWGSQTLCVAKVENADFRGVNFKEAGLRYIDLTGFDLRDSNLEGASLRHASKANLSKVNLDRARLDRVNFQDTNLSGASLVKANLRSRHLIKTNFKNANLQKANLHGAKPIQANFEDANLQNANLENVNFKGANLKNANLVGADLRGADLRVGNWQQANFNGATYRLADALEKSGEKYPDTIFPKEFDPVKAGMVRVEIIPDLSKVDPRTIDLRGKYLYQENLDGKDLSGLDFSEANLTEISFAGANLTNTNFSETSFLEVSMENADLRNARLHRLVLQRVNLKGANLQGGTGTVEKGGGPGDPIPNALVELLDASGALIISTTTDVNGNYSFNNLFFGNYIIRVNINGVTHDGEPVKLSPIVQTVPDLNFVVEEGGVMTDIKEISFLESLQISPNPATTLVNVNLMLAQQAEVQLTLTNLLGQHLVNGQHDLTQGRQVIQLDLSNYPTGLYLITLRSGKEVLTKKVFKE